MPEDVDEALANIAIVFKGGAPPDIHDDFERLARWHKLAHERHQPQEE